MHERPCVGREGRTIFRISQTTACGPRCFLAELGLLRSGALATDYSYPPQAGCIAAIPFPKSAQDVGEQLRHGEDFLCHWETHVRITVVASN